MREIKKVQKNIYYHRVKKHQKILKTFMRQDKLLLIFMIFMNFTTRASERRHQARQEGEGLKILTRKQMCQRLIITLAQISTGNNSESLLNEIRQIIYSLHRSKEITKKVYNNIIKSIKV